MMSWGDAEGVFMEQKPIRFWLFPPVRVEGKKTNDKKK
jgi:hypothetical protein